MCFSSVAWHRDGGMNRSDIPSLHGVIVKKALLSPLVIALSTLTLVSCGSDDSNDSDTPKDENKALEIGQACTSDEECLSQYCDETKHCAEKSTVPPKKAIGESCTHSDECLSAYCDETKHCAEEVDVNVNKANGEECASADECQSGYCNNQNRCDDAPSANGKANGETCQTGAECASHYCSFEGLCSDKPNIHREVIALQDIPNGQNNTDGATCDPATFVEHCDGDVLVWCEQTKDKQYVVKTDACDEAHPSCVLTLLNGANHVMCVGSSDKCSASSKDEINCDHDDYGNEIDIHFECSQTEDGSYYYVYAGTRYCLGACTQKSCIEQTCDPDKGRFTCSEDGKYMLECDETPDGRYVYHSYACSQEGSDYLCQPLEDYDGWAMCM